MNGVRGVPAAGAAAVVLASALTACTGGGVGGGDGADGTVLRYAFYGPEQSHAGAQMTTWAEELEERTDGQVTVELFFGGTLLNTGDIYDGVSSGVVDVGLDSPHNDEGRFPQSSVFSLPLGATDTLSLSEAYLEFLESEEPAEFEDYEVLTAFTAEPSYVHTVDPVRRSQDLEGLTLRTGGANIGLVEELGAQTVGMPIPEVAEALQTGVVDGYVSSRDVLKSFGLAEFVKSATDYPFGTAGLFVAVMDKDQYEALSDDVKDVMEELKPEMSEFAAQRQEEIVDQAVSEAEEQQNFSMVELDQADQTTWDTAVDNAIDAWLDQQSGKNFDAQATLDRARELLEGAE